MALFARNIGKVSKSSFVTDTLTIVCEIFSHSMAVVG